MKLSKKAKAIFKPVGVDLNTYKVDPTKKFNKRTAPGLKKGSGGIADAGLSGGVAECSMPLIHSIVSEAIEDITDTEEANIDFSDEGAQPNQFGELGEPEQEALTRYVKGAHLVYKRQAGVDTYEELWIFPIDSQKPTEHTKIEQQILAGTDIESTTMASEDGSQRATSWVAGNAKMLHITGLVN